MFETFNVFPDAIVEPLISIIRKCKSSDNNITDKFIVYLEDRTKRKTDIRIFDYNKIFLKDSLIFNYRETEKESKLYHKIKSNSNPLISHAKITTGIKPYQVGKGMPKQTKEIVDKKPFNTFHYTDGWKKLIRGTQVNRYSLYWDNEYINYGIWLAEPRLPEIFSFEKLFIRRTDDRLLCVYDDKGFVGLNSIHCIQITNNDVSIKFILSLLNSHLLNWFFQHENFHMVGKPMAEIKVVFVERLPIIVANNQDLFINKADDILILTDELNNLSNKFQHTIQRKFNIEDLPTKLQNWYTLTYKEFIAELGKKKIKLSLSDEAEWEDYFIQESAKAQELKVRINATDQEIDRMVYQLYELTEEEIERMEKI